VGEKCLPKLILGIIIIGIDKNVIFVVLYSSNG
jgi:hypothetical protein